MQEDSNEIEQENSFNELVRKMNFYDEYDKDMWSVIDRLEETMSSVMSLTDLIVKLMLDIKKKINSKKE